MDKNIEKALEIFKTLDENTPLGRYEVSEALYYNVQEYTTDLEENRLFEVHRIYADIQCMLKGEEVIYTADAGALKMERDVLEESDAIFYSGGGVGTPHLIGKGEYLILYPGEVHKPGVCTDAPAPAKKVVFKVKMG